MKDSIQAFYFERREVRVIEKDGEPWFVAKDVCAVLELTVEATRRLDDDEKGLTKIQTLGGEQDMSIISESGLYTLIMRSNKPEARAFRKWVTRTVLPAIRKYGRYETPRPAKAPKPKITMSSARMVLKEAGLRGNQLALALDKYVRHYTGDSVLAICGVSLESPSPRQLLTPTEIGAELGLSNQKVNKLLQDAGYQLRLVNGTWEPTDVGEPYAAMLDTGKRHGDGTPVRQLKWDSSVLRVVRERAGNAVQID